MVNLLCELQHQVAVKNPHGASTSNNCQETAAREKPGQCCVNLITYFKPLRYSSSSKLADVHGAIAASDDMDGPQGWEQTQGPQVLLATLTNTLSAPVKAASYRSTIISCSQQMLQYQS